MYLAGSVVLIIVAIAVTAVVNRFRSPDTSADIRTKAGTTTTLQFTGTVTSVDENKGTLEVSNLQFADGSSADGSSTWTVTPPPGVSISSLSGAKITFTVAPSTFLIATHTVTATQITVVR